MSPWPWHRLPPRPHPDSLQPSWAERSQERSEEEKERATEHVEEKTYVFIRNGHIMGLNWNALSFQFQSSFAAVLI